MLSTRQCNVATQFPWVRISRKKNANPVFWVRKISKYLSEPFWRSLWPKEAVGSKNRMYLTWVYVYLWFFFDFDLNFSVLKNVILTARNIGHYFNIRHFFLQILTQGNCGAMEWAVAFKRELLLSRLFVKTKRNESCEKKRSIAWSNYFSSRDQ